MDNKEFMKKMAKSGASNAAKAMDNKIDNSGNDMAGDIAKTGKDTAKAAVHTGKMAAKLAMQDYLGAFKEFMKDPKGVLLMVTTPLLAILLVIVIVMNTLTNTIWNVIGDKPVSSMVDEYIDDLNYAEKNCFYKACDEVSKNALNEISNKVLAIDLGDSNLNKTKTENFKNADTIQNNLGMGYNAMRRYSANGNYYPQYDKVLMGESKIFSVTEDESNGFEVNYNNAGMTANTVWQRITHIIDFNTNEKTYQKYIKKTNASYENASFDGLQSELDKTNKALYTFVYDNERINASGYTFSMFEMIFNQKYDFEAQKEINEGPNSLAAKFETGLAELEENRDKVNFTGKMYAQALGQLKTAYGSAGNKAFYLNSDYISEFNKYVDIYNNKYLKDAEEDAKYKHLASDEDFINGIADGARKDRKKAFKEFISKEDFYKGLLSSSVSVTCTNTLGGNPVKLKIPNSTTKLKGKDIQVKNVAKTVTININVDVADYNKLAQLFGYKFKDSNGKWVDNEELLSWIILNGGLDPEEVKNSNKESESNNSSENVSSEAVIGEIQNLNVDANSFLWPLDTSVEGISISSKFGERDNPFGGGKENHKGLDISAPMNTKIAASIPGKVIRAGWSDSYGNVVEIESQVKIGNDTKTVRTLYAHMAGICVSVDNVITRGENLIGYVGSSGKSTGPHLHFEVKVKNDSIGEFENVDPESLLNGDGLYYLNSSALADFDGSLNSFFENCKDSGTATASILTDAGYTKSSMYWQYKNNVYNVMFKSSIDDSTKQKFFVDLDNIAKNEDGSLKIIEFSSADFSKSDNSAFNNIPLAEDSELKYNKRYYAVYCYPDTVVQMNMSAYRTNFKYERLSKSQDFKDNFFGNKVAGSIGGVNYIISRLPCDISKSSKVANYIAGDVEKIAVNKKEEKNKLSISSYNKNDYEATQQFSMLSYVFSNISYGFEVANLQITFPDGNGGEHLMTAADYNNNNYGVFHLNKDIKNKTVTEWFNNDSSNSDFQIRDCILGNVLNANFYPKSWQPYDESNPDTYPYFVVSVADIQNAPKNGMQDAEPPALEEIFDLDIVGDNAYVDGESSMTWPLVKSYEHTNDIYPLFSGQVLSVDKDNSQVIVKDSFGTKSVIKNIIPEENITGSFTKDTLLGEVADGSEVQMANIEQKEDGSIKETQILNAGQQLKTVLSISSRSETSMSENSEGRYNKVLSMMSGNIIEATKNSLKVKSEEEGLYFEYKNFCVDDEIFERVEAGEKVPVTGGSEVGILYLTDSDGDCNHLYATLYSEGNEFGSEIQYYNPANYFKFLKEEETAARKILIQSSSGQNLSGIILNRGCNMQLTSKVTPDSARGAPVIWSSDNPSLVWVDQSGKLTAASDKYGIATISCSFAEGEGISASCIVNVPEKLVDISLSCANGYIQPENGSLSNDKYKPCTLAMVDPNAVLEIIMKNNTAKADFNAYTTQTAALKTVKWSIVDKNGNPNNKYATIDDKGSLVSTNPMKENQTLYAKAESADNIGKPVSVTVAFRIVQPLKSIKLSPDALDFVFNDKNDKTKSYSYTCEPANATYQSIDTILTGGADKAFSLNKDNKTVTATAVGSGYLKIISKKYPNITSQAPLKSGLMIDNVEIQNKPNELMSGEKCQLDVRAYYKGEEVDINSEGIEKNWKTTTYTSATNGAIVSEKVSFDSDNLILNIPQVQYKSIKVKLELSVDTMYSKDIKDSFTVKVYPFVVFLGKSSVGQNLHQGTLYNCPVYVRNIETASDITVNKSGTIYDKIKYSFLPGGFTAGELVQPLHHFEDDTTIEFINSDTVSVKYDEDENKLSAALVGDNVSGLFTVKVKFKDGKEYLGDFQVVKPEEPEESD